jgi:beta-glucosidase-like glycosyl hydrolase/CubicO group peptidase (beta-lactamase class C family)
MTAAALVVLSACGAPPASRPLGPAVADPGVALDASERRWVEGTLTSLTLREKVGQLVIVWIPGGYASTASDEFDALTRWVVEEGIGGVAISIGLPHGYVAKLNRLQERARVPLLVTADFESGGPGMRLSSIYALPSLLSLGGGTMLPPTMAFGAIGDERFAYELGRITGREARAVGVHVTLAPVLDVNSNPENPIINTRSFGEDPELVARLGVAFIRGAHASGLLTTAKHYPGHGDTQTDSHLELPAISATRERLDTVELVPFRRAVAAGVDAIMTAHIAAPEILGPDAPPATLAPYFLDHLLRREFGFEGVILTDAIRMDAIANRYGVGDAAVLALDAGADVILAPRDVAATIDAVSAAVREGRLSEARIDASLRRVLELKARAGLHRGSLIDAEAVDAIVGNRAHLAFADSAAARSITLPRDRDALIPIDTSRIERLLSVVFSRRTDAVAGRYFHLSVAPYFQQLDTVWVNYGTHPATYDSLATLADSADLTLVSVYVSPRAGAGTVGVPEPFADFVSRLVASGRPCAVLSFGNPYLLTDFPDVGTYMIAWGGREVSQRAAARAVLGESGISGRLPISLPPFHRAGEGLRLPVLAKASPGEVGMSVAGLARVDSIIEAAIADSATPGAALAVGRHGRLVRLRGYGRLDWEPGAAAVTDSSIYDMASVTKVVGTTTALMLLTEEGRIDLDAPLASYLPWFTGAGKETITVRQLLLHRGGLPGWIPFWQEVQGRAAYQSALAAVAPIALPGDTTVYSDLGFIMLGFLVEEVGGARLDEFLDQRLFAPLGMGDSGFNPDSALWARVAPTEVDTVFRFEHVHGVVHDENAFALGGVAGHAGFFSSARDLAVFAQMMLDGGTLARCPALGAPCAGGAGPVTIVGADAIAGFTARYDSAATRALGWDTPNDWSSGGQYLTYSAFGHTGFTGTSLWMDPELDVFVVLLTTRVNPTRENQKHIPLRRAVHDAVAQAIRDVAIRKRDAAPSP